VGKIFFVKHKGGFIEGCVNLNFWIGQNITIEKVRSAIKRGTCTLYCCPESVMGAASEQSKYGGKRGRVEGQNR